MPMRKDKNETNKRNMLDGVLIYSKDTQENSTEEHLRQTLLRLL